MSFNLLLEDGNALLLELGDNLLLEASPKMPNLILFDAEDFRPSPAGEETTPFYTANLIDEDDAIVAVDIIEAMMLRVYVDNDAETILRDNQDVLNVNDVWITYGLTATVLEWLVQVGDTRLSDITETKEKHVALFEYAWDSASSESITAGIDTTESDATVNINIVAHGMTGDDNHIFIDDPDEVGGLCLGGSHFVTNIVDVDNIEIEARKVATSTASGGGTVTIWINPKILKHEVKFIVNRAEPSC